MEQRPVAAFFDFDLTLIDVESPKIGIRYLWDLGMVSFPYVLKIMLANVFYKRHLISEQRMAQILVSFYKNRPFALFEAGAQEYYRDVIRPHLAPNIVARLRWHKERGHILVLISAGLRYLLTPVVEDLGFDYLFCTDLEIRPDGMLTGRTQGPVCTDEYKRIYALELAEELDLDLTASFAYGNHNSDLPMLELVGNPHAVEPNDRLRNVANKKGWPILTYA
ncbi:MAG: HAD-IB family hydrolase [Desulfomonilia bacterium]|nr:HAD-IB family hydrolase [Desulfomonilia bacterium]